jgi:hypothetical protein
VLHMIPAPGAEWRAVIDPTTFRLVEWRAVMGPEFLKSAMAELMQEEPMSKEERAMAGAMLGAMADPLIGRMAVAVKIDIQQLDDAVTDDRFVFRIPDGVPVRQAADFKEAMELGVDDPFNAGIGGASVPQPPPEEDPDETGD